MRKILFSLTNFPEYWFEFVYLYDGICIHLNEEIVNFYKSMIISKRRPYDFRGATIVWSNYIFSSSSQVNYFFFDRADVAGNLYQTEMTVLRIGYILTDQNNRQRLRIPGLGNIFGLFFFKFSKVNVLKINLTKIFLIYASVNHIRIFQRMFFFNICTSKPHKNLVTPVWRRILLSVHKLD
jgi:hypothetical protein